MRWLRREAAGRHALGAAVTAIPSGPPPVPSVVPVPAQPDAVVPVQPVSSATPLPADAVPVVVDVPDPAEPAETPDVVLPPLPLAPVSEPAVVEDRPFVPAQHVPADPALPVAQPVVPVQAGPVEPVDVEHLLALAPVVQAPVPPVPVPADPAPADLVPADPSTEPAPVLPPLTVLPPRPGPRVELGFADGTYRMLDPESETARVLADLVGELTSAPPRETPPQTTAPGSSGAS